MDVQDKNIEYLKLLGYIYMRYGKWEKAKIIFEAIKELAPPDIYTSKALAYTYLKTGDFALSAAEAETIINDGGESSYELGLYFKGKALLALGNEAESKTIIERILQRRST
ncbi:MAG: hypothetical protein HQL01_02625 [Nitrospirae bacterium]|nr:hypothetical protein [Nitrospirota bacterium]